MSSRGRNLTVLFELTNVFGFFCRKRYVRASGRLVKLIPRERQMTILPPGLQIHFRGDDNSQTRKPNDNSASWLANSFSGRRQFPDNSVPRGVHLFFDSSNSFDPLFYSTSMTPLFSESLKKNPCSLPPTPLFCCFLPLP